MKRRKHEPPRNVPASVKARLLQLARAQGEDFNALLVRYVLERFLYRLSTSPYSSGFLLKGAILFTVWSRRPHRATKDIDLLGFGAPDLDRLQSVFRDVCTVSVDNDGLRFAADEVRAVPIREEAVYDGVRVTFTAYLGTARVPVQVDVGFGDATTPPPEMVELPTLLDHPAPRLRGYRREVTLAEKLHAMVDLGIANSRMKDYFDVWFLAENFTVDGTDLTGAVRSTFTRRRTPVPTALPAGLSHEFAEDPAKVAQWKAFTTRTRLAVEAPSLLSTVEAIARFVMPVFESIAEDGSLAGTWSPGGPWTKAPSTQDSA
jgi:predicted nucleotidyltransferase component of viral defense system